MDFELGRSVPFRYCVPAEPGDLGPLVPCKATMPLDALPARQLQGRTRICERLVAGAWQNPHSGTCP